MNHIQTKNAASLYDKLTAGARAIP
jgi:hypothetical protein